jgi:phage major head subunit gpT-like protein
MLATFSLDCEDCEIIAAEGSGPKRFKVRAYNGGAMQINAWSDPVVIDLSGMTAAKSIVANLHHESTAIVGHVDEVTNSGKRLDLGGVLSGTGPAAQEFAANAANGFPWQASVEAKPIKLREIPAGQAVEVNGQKIAGPVTVATKSKLYGIAFVPRGADENTSVKIAAGAATNQKETDMEFSKWIEAMGLVEADLTEAQIEALKKKHAAEIKAAASDGKEVKAPAFDLDGLKAAYAKHEAAIEASAFKYADKVRSDKLAEIKAGALAAAVTLKQQALEHEWAPQRFEVEALKAAHKVELDLLTASAPKGPAVHGSRNDASSEVIQAALCKSAGLQSLDKAFKPETLEAADKQFSGLGLQELILMAARENGYSGRESITVGNAREVMHAAFSTHSLTTLITTTGNKMLLDGFSAIPQSWRKVAKAESVNDFKAATAFRMNANLEYEELGPSGEIKHGTASQESYTLQAVTYAKMLAITLQDIVNDDLRAFDQIRQKLGIGAAVKMSNLFWQTWLTASNAGVFWASGRSNLATSCALSLTNLATAVQKFRDMEGPDGNLMELDPTLLLVPSALEATAKNLFSSQEIRDTTASTKIGTANIYQGMFVPVVVPQLAKSTFTGYSATTWWLCADPAVLASAAMVFLNGQQNPVIESSEADFNTLGVQFRGYHHFGAAMTEYRASVKCTA